MRPVTRRIGPIQSRNLAGFLNPGNTRWAAGSGKTDHGTPQGDKAISILMVNQGMQKAYCKFFPLCL